MKEFPFKFYIPRRSPPSLYAINFSRSEKARALGIKYKLNNIPYTGKIKYILKAYVDKPMAINPKDKVFLDVLPPPIKGHKKRLVEYPNIMLPGGIEITTSTSGKKFAPGDLVKGQFRAVFPPNSKVRDVTASLCFNYNYTAQGRTNECNQAVDRITWLKKPELDEMIEEFEFVVPDNCPFSVNGKYVRIGSLVRIGS